MRRRRGSLLTGLAVLLALAGVVAGYVKLELADPESFADHSVAALRSPAVRSAIAEQVAIAVVERHSPDLVASRPLVLAAVEAVLETDEFAKVLRRAAVAANRTLLHGDSDVIVELREARRVLLPAIRSASPKLARQIPADLNPRIAEIRRTDAAALALRVADGAEVATVPLLVASLVAFGLAIALASDRRRAIGIAGLGLTAGAAAGLIAMAALRAQVLSHTDQLGVLSEHDARAAAGAAWDGLAGGLEQWLMAIGWAGLAVAAGGVLARARIDRAAALRRLAEVVAGGSMPRLAHLARGAVLAALGALVLLDAQPLASAVVVVLGATLVVFGLAEALSTVGQGERLEPRARSRRRRVAAAATAAAVLTGSVAVVAISAGGGAPSPPKKNEITACNGLRLLCDRRLDQVVLPGTHNSMSAADRPGWFFANQKRPIPRQLADGIRLLLIDVHYGVVDARGRVRTDLRAEGTDRNRVAGRLGTSGVRVAERLAGRLGLVPAEGRRELFLCHTLCELGAERMGAALNGIRGFLERSPADVLVIFVESSVRPAEVEQAFEDADLEPYLATLRRDEPLPTLREMIASGRRLVVLDDGDGGDASWYHPGYVFVQDTRIGSLLRSRTACDPGRGTPDSPLFMVNHWIDRFPPPLSADRNIGDRATLLRRVRSCRASIGRTPNLIAVDFYDQSDVIATARALNLRGAVAAAPASTPSTVHVSLDPDGTGPMPERSVTLRCGPSDGRTGCRRLRALASDTLSPVPRDSACTQIYGGPQTGRIQGLIAGRAVDARFERTDGCEIARYDAVAPLLRLAR